MIWACAALFVVGTGLVARGLIGRRVGDEPRCRRCGYNLTGNESLHCSECGLILVAGCVRIGVRRRRRGALAVGALVLVAAGALTSATASGWIARTNFYQFVPFDLVLQSAEKGAPAAIADLRRRWGTKTLSPIQVRSVADAALRVEERTPVDPNGPFWLDVLDDPVLVNSLTAAQRETYLNNLQRFTIVAPRRRRQREILPIAIQVDCSPLRRGLSHPTHFGGRGWSYGVADGRIVVRGTDASDEDLEAAIYGGSERTVGERNLVELSRIETDFLTVGKHEILASFQCKLYRNDGAGGPNRDSPWTRAVTITSNVEIADMSGPPSLVAVSDPATAELVRSHIQLMHEGSWEGQSSWTIRTDRPPPCTIVGTLLLVNSTSECRLWQHFISTMSGSAIASTRSSFVTDCSSVTSSESGFSLVLRPQLEAALAVPDANEVWAEDLEIGCYVWTDRATGQIARVPAMGKSERSVGSE